MYKSLWEWPSTTKNILLVQPSFPIPKKRKIKHESIPIGLLKIGTYLRDCKKYNVKLVLGNQPLEFPADEVWITSLFTYWSDYVHESIEFYRSVYPNAAIVVGGIYASLMPECLQKIKGIKVVTGQHHQAEEWCRNHGVDYSLLDVPVDMQIIHSMRGCFRRCDFCGTWKIERKEEFYRDISKLIKTNHVVFYDNNLLRHPDIVEILKELAALRVNGKRVIFESQSGFDGRILTDEIAKLLKKANFKNPRIAWDHAMSDESSIKGQIDMLTAAGYSSKDIYVFILYNYKYNFSVVEQKRLKCWDWGVQISDCRYRPLTQTFDHYSPRKKQDSTSYYIHEDIWTDEDVKRFRGNVRKHNICVRHGFPFHSKILERKAGGKELVKKLIGLNEGKLREILPDVWYPGGYDGKYY